MSILDAPRPAIQPYYDKAGQFVGFYLTEWNDHSQKMQPVGPVQQYGMELAAQWTIADRRHSQLCTEAEQIELEAQW